MLNKDAFFINREYRIALKKVNTDEYFVVNDGIEKQAQLSFI